MEGHFEEGQSGYADGGEVLGVFFPGGGVEELLIFSMVGECVEGVLNGVDGDDVVLCFPAALSGGGVGRHV